MHERIKGSFRYFVITAVCLFLILGCLVLYAGVQEANLKKAEAVRETKIYAERIEALLNSLFHKTDILESIIITSNGEVPEETFHDRQSRHKGCPIPAGRGCALLLSLGGQ